MKSERKLLALLSIGVILNTALSAQDEIPQSNTYSKASIPSGYNSSYPPLDTANLKPLKIGDKVPDIVFEEMVNYHFKTAKLSDFKGKVILLDFWSVSCAICIKQFPKLKELQQRFNEDVVILAVGFDGNRKGSIAEFVKKRDKSESPIKLPIPIIEPNNKILEKLFPFSGMPHEIWIDPSGILAGITNHHAITDYNLKLVKNGKPLKSLTKSKLINVGKNDPFLISQGPLSTYDSWGSLVSKYNKGIICGWPFGAQYDSGFFRFFDINRTVYDYYYNSYKLKYPWLDRKRIIIENKSEFYKIKKDLPNNYNDRQFSDFADNNLFCYELILPKQNYNWDNAINYLISDLDEKFGTKSWIDDRKIKYYALVKSTIESLKFNDKTTPKSTFIEYIDGEKVINFNCEKADNILKELSKYISTNLTFQNETNYNGNLSLKIIDKMYTISEMNILLESIGLKLIEKEKILPMLILQRKTI